MSHIDQHDIIACRIEISSSKVSVGIVPELRLDATRFEYGSVVDHLIGIL